MNEKLDLRGLLCPEPVLASKRMLDKKETESIEALVDDQICVANLERLARSLKALCNVIEKDGFFAVTISKASAASDGHKHADGSTGSAASSAAIAQSASGANGNQKQGAVGTIVFITREQFGEGDPDFSKTLFDVFLQSLFEGGHRPRAILLANAGVKLMAKDSKTRKVLDDFRDNGCEVLACGLCVEFYKLKEDIEKEQITNMFAICEYLNAADKLLQF